MSHAVKQIYVDFEEYLEDEREADVRHEYVDGQIYAMGGASELHNTVAADFHTAINNILPDTCRAWMADMKVKIKAQGKFYAYYPDIMVACGENTDDPYTRTNPILIVEVLSASTRRNDLKEKFDNYIQIPSLLEYVVVSQDTPHLRIFRRNRDWQPESYYAGDIFCLESVGLELAVEAIYRRVRREVGLEIKLA
ncbi:Endonuclease, Uma2 family (restriction endonuclease fold) [Methylomagnum ishizawai]|uniref:Endonuclease, Uma2 family (Restriction endonuclease fold) n=1 Tax=Methylomagnum ishizawai TaxID=1760988 RepID=A0A1Y6CX59_9GAMM|nr:Uma2 family endonuclease [Methylomagnum ishizawai]SMF94866.1 Endonuclease, Uma2 family (restriction endonuclease fold) [Methylomagnum ishizawai]